MYNRPLVLKGNINIKNDDKCIIGKIIKNKNVETKENYIQVLDNENLNSYEKGYLGYIFENEPQNIDLDKINYCSNIKNYETLLDYDVVEIVDKFYVKVLRLLAGRFLLQIPFEQHLNFEFGQVVC